MDNQMLPIPIITWISDLYFNVIHKKGGRIDHEIKKISIIQLLLMLCLFKI